MLFSPRRAMGHTLLDLQLIIVFSCFLFFYVPMAMACQFDEFDINCPCSTLFDAICSYLDVVDVIYLCFDIIDIFHPFDIIF